MILHLGHGDEPPPAEPADLSLHPALLVGSLDAGGGEARGEPVVGPERDEPVLLHPALPPKHPGHRGPQVVEAHGGEDPALKLQGPGDPVEERGLGRPGVGPVQGRARGLRAHRDDRNLDRLASHEDLGLVEVHLGLGPLRVVLRDEGHRAHPELAAALTDVVADRGGAHPHPELLGDPLEDPGGGVALLAGCLPVGPQDPVDESSDLPGEHGALPIRALALRRDRGSQRLAHGTAVDPVHPGQRPDRGAGAGVTADLLEQLHPAHPFSPFRGRARSGR